MSRANVTKLIAALERHLDVQLLNRNTQYVVPTEAGLLLMDKAETLLQDLHALEATVRNSAIDPAGTVRVGVPPSFGAAHLVPAVAAFQRSRPRSRIVICLDRGDAELVRDGLDLSLRIATLLKDASYIARLLVRVPQVLVAAPAYLQRRGVPASIADLARHDCLVHMLKSPSSQWLFSEGGQISSHAVSGPLVSDFGHGPVIALSGLSLQAHAGTITAVVGANGAGKSSLLRAISGLAPVAAGQIRVDGTDITRSPPQRRARLGVSHAMEGRRIFRGMTVHDNLQLAWSFGRRRTRWADALARVYDTFPILSQKAATPAGLLSGGQQQMMIMSSATMCDPALMLLDEPSLGLAPIIVQQIYAFLQSYRREHGVAILLSEQMAAFALRIADQGYILRRGKVVQHGSGQTLLGAGARESLSEAYI